MTIALRGWGYTARFPGDSTGAALLLPDAQPVAADGRDPRQQSLPRDAPAKRRLYPAHQPAVPTAWPPVAGSLEGCLGREGRLPAGTGPVCGPGPGARGDGCPCRLLGTGLGAAAP